MINDIYNKDVLRLAADISRIDPLESPDARVHVRSPLCGSTLDIDLAAFPITDRPLRPARLAKRRPP